MGNIIEGYHCEIHNHLSYDGQVFISYHQKKNEWVSLLRQANRGRI